MNYFLFQGTAQLFGVGCAMTMLRTIIPRILTPMKALKALKFSHLKLGLFFGGYIGIYRVSCVSIHHKSIIIVKKFHFVINVQ